MKCLAVFNSIPDLSYLWIDTQFKELLVKKGVEIQLVDPNISLTYIDDDTIISLAGHYFNPLVNSNKYLREVNNSYQTIECQNGFTYVMNQLPELELFFIAVCGDGEESELFLQRKIRFFHRMLLFLYGPCAVEHLRPPFPDKRKLAWENLNKWLDSWTRLCEQEQMYLVEALERLHVNQELNSVSLNLLGEVLAKGNKDSTLHAMLIVNNKLLGLYSSERSLELKSSDILMLIVLLKKNFKYVDDIIPRSVYRTPLALTRSLTVQKPDSELFKKKEKSDGSLSPENFEFHSPPSTPVDEGASQDRFYTPRNSALLSPNFMQNITEEKKEDVEKNDQFLTPSVSLETKNKIDFDYDLTMSDIEDALEGEFKGLQGEINENTHEQKEQILNNVSKNDITNEDDVSKEEDEEESKNGGDEDEEEIIDDILHKNIFLQTNENLYAPYTAHCLLLGNATVLVLLSQHRQMYLAFYVQGLLRCLNCILAIGKHKVLSYRLKLLEDCHRYVSRIQSYFFRTNEFRTNRIGKYYKSFEKSWKVTQNAGLADFINSETISVDMNSRLENSLVGLIKASIALFTQLFISLNTQTYTEAGQVRLFNGLRDLAIQKLSHYESFLEVRGQQNVTMTAYHNDFPGLIHYIYINRTTDQLIAPTVNVNIDSNSSMYVLIKQRIWDYWQYSETMLSKGYTSYILRDGDFCFSYFIWFEDSFGKPMVSPKSLKDLNENKPTGILSGHFYKNLTHHLFPTVPKGSTNCYELLCMHVGLVSNQFVAAACKKLSRYPEGCSEASSPEIIL